MTIRAFNNFAEGLIRVQSKTTLNLGDAKAWQLYELNMLRSQLVDFNVKRILNGGLLKPSSRKS
ncbi:MAG: hypothetical protein NZ954_04580 [Thermofilaceae archaeon]|nr:hypothetical protein [Thermofilaceae archaeon]MCX8180082.1 hypothetical protein [Thermofilaceae archaeon]MDW8004263.1 hypothetical protein [Thermofilaceae archaeon]